MEHSSFAQLLENELTSAILNSDKNAIKRVSLLLDEKISEIEKIKKEQEETKSDIKMLIEVIKQGFEHMDKRFEDMQKYMDKRFEDMQRYMDKRFEDMNKRFDMMFKFMALGYSLITLLIVVFKFIH